MIFLLFLISQVGDCPRMPHYILSLQSRSRIQGAYPTSRPRTPPTVSSFAAALQHCNNREGEKKALDLQTASCTSTSLYKTISANKTATLVNNRILVGKKVSANPIIRE
mmetsp:Transcript_22833/g.47441  ORF Transcript_22833/g.47441 Transcript_22833/m.47441 type:complete len:109 (-) Transcript_22833:693-1019(-)